MRRVCLLLLAAVLAFLLSGCGNSTAGDSKDAVAATPGASHTESPLAEPSATNTPDTSSPAASPEPSASASHTPDDDSGNKLKQAALDIVDMLRERDLGQLAGVIDPEEGLLFSPYPHIDVKTARIFKSGELPSFKDSAKLNWGSYDGSGDPIELTFRDYFEKFVYDQDFAGAPNVSVDKIMGQGNAAFNGREVWPDASFVEFHFPGFDKQYDGMDWRSLVLVLRPSGGDWKLCAIVHGQWTI